MKQSELVRAVSLGVGVSQGVAKAVLDAALEVIGEKLRAGDPVRLKGLGTLRPATMAARVYVQRYVDQDTGKVMKENVLKPDRKTVRFKVSKALRDSLNR